MEVNRVLSRDQTATMKKMAAVEAQMTQEKERTERRRAEVNEVIKKVRLSLTLTTHQGEINVQEK